MADDSKRIPQLKPSTTGVKDGKLAAYNRISNDTEQVTQQKMLGATKASFAWQADVPYSIGDLKEFNELVWRSLINSNIGNIPAENSFWTNEPISTSDGITDTQYANGVFTYDNSKVIYNNAQYYHKFLYIHWLLFYISLFYFLKNHFS